MSSTNRGYDRHKSDYYVTPVDKIEEFLHEFIKHEPSAFDERIIDPCAGGDETHPMSYPTALFNAFGISGMNGKVTTIDIREDSLAHIKKSFLETKFKILPRTIITNPPFNLADEIIKKSLDDVEEYGFVVMLLRLNFFGGKKRKEKFWDKIGLPKYTFVHHRRMSFTEDNKTDSIEYAHFVWQKGYKPEFTQLVVI